MNQKHADPAELGAIPNRRDRADDVSGLGLPHDVSHLDHVGLGIEGELNRCRRAPQLCVDVLVDDRDG